MKNNRNFESSTLCYSKHTRGIPLFCHSEYIRGTHHLVEMLYWRLSWHYYHSEALAQESRVTVAWTEILPPYGRQIEILVISNVCERSHNRLTWREILHFTTFRSEWQLNVIPSTCEGSLTIIAGNSSRHSLSEWHTFWQEILHFAMLHSEWQSFWKCAQQDNHLSKFSFREDNRSCSAARGSLCAPLLAG